MWDLAPEPPNESVAAPTLRRSSGTDLAVADNRLAAGKSPVLACPRSSGMEAGARAQCLRSPSIQIPPPEADLRRGRDVSRQSDGLLLHRRGHGPRHGEYP